MKMVHLIRPRFSSRRVCGWLHATVAVLAASAVQAGSICYEVTGGDLTPTLTAAPAGLAASALVVGSGLGNLFDNGGSPDSLRISGDDTENTTAAAFDNDAVLSFSVTIPSGVVVNLLSLSLDHQATLANNYSNARVFSNLRGHTDAVADTIGVLGRRSSGSDLSVVSGSISLASPTTNATAGSSIAAGDFDGLSDQTVTFYLPWIDSSTSASRFTDIDNLTLTYDVVRPPVITALELLSNRTFRITFTGTSGRTYSLRASNSLQQSLADWMELDSGTLGFAPTTFIDLLDTLSQRFYAAIEPPVTRIMCVGDSITAGSSTYWVYRQPLWQKLTDAGHVFEFVGSQVTPASGNTLRHEGYGGKAAEYVAGVLPTTFAAHPADFVLIHSGHNHFDTDNPPDGPVPLIVDATESIINTCRSINPDVTILLAQVITSNKLPKYSYIPDLNVALQALATEMHSSAQPVIVVDQASGFDPDTDTVSDLVHPNADGAEKMATRWYETLDPILP